MFRVHIDDSGTDPSQQVAIATALIMPAARIAALDREWKTLTENEGFSDFHMSVCVARNEKSQFAGWSEDKQQRVIRRVRHIGKKFGLKGLSLACNKADYDELVLPRLPFADRYHYTWAIRALIDLIDKWGDYSKVTTPFEYIYDWMDPKTQREAKGEIDTVMAQAEEEASEAGLAGRYTNYTFRRRQDIPGLQCTDALAWTCYRFALLAHLKTPLNQIAQESWDDYYEHLSQTWLYAATVKREHLNTWVEAEVKDGRSEVRFRAWEEKKAKGKGQ
jgi:Protein of unknown function (DUF3800)